MVATVGREKLEVGAGVAWPASLVGLSSSLKATTPKTSSRAARTTYQRRHHGPLDDGPLGGDPQPPGCCWRGSQPSGEPVDDPQPGACGDVGGGPCGGRSDPGDGDGPQPCGLTQRSGIAPHIPEPDNSSHVTNVQHALIVTARLMTGAGKRFELHCGCHRRPRSGSCRFDDLRFR